MPVAECVQDAVSNVGRKVRKFTPQCRARQCIQSVNSSIEDSNMHRSRHLCRFEQSVAKKRNGVADMVSRGTEDNEEMCEESQQTDPGCDFLGDKEDQNALCSLLPIKKLRSADKDFRIWKGRLRQ